MTVKEWWDKAKRDLVSAGLLYWLMRYAESSFFAQQAAEKALKAVLIKQSGKLIKTHDIEFLGRRIDLPASYETDCRMLTFVYSIARYPGAAITFNRTKARQNINAAKRIMKWAEQHI